MCHWTGHHTQQTVGKPACGWTPVSCPVSSRSHRGDSAFQRGGLRESTRKGSAARRSKSASRRRAATTESIRALLCARMTFSCASMARSRSRCLRDGPPNGSPIGNPPPSRLRRYRRPAPRAATTSNASSRHFTSRSACVSGGGSIAPVVSATPRLSVTARNTESKRTGLETRVSPTVALAAGAPGRALGVVDVGAGLSLAGVGLGWSDGAGLGGGCVVSTSDVVRLSRVGEGTASAETGRADERSRCRDDGTGGTGGTGACGITYSTRSETRSMSVAGTDDWCLTNPDPAAPKTTSVVPNVTHQANPKLAACSLECVRKEIAPPCGVNGEASDGFRASQHPALTRRSATSCVSP